MRGPINNFPRHLLTSIAAIVVALAIFLGFLDGSRGLPSLSSSYEVRAIVPAASALAQNSRVTEAGVAVGWVQSVTRQGLDARIQFTVDGAHSPIPVDSRVAITLDTVLGEKSVSLTPGSSPRMLPNNGVLATTQADPFVEVDQLLSVLHGATKARAEQAIQGLSGAVAGQGPQLNALLQGASQMIINGDRTQVADLVSNLAQITQRIGSEGTALVSVSQNLTTTFRALASRDAAVTSIIDQLPATLAQVRATSGVLNTTTALAAPVIFRLGSAIQELSPTVHLLGPAATEGDMVIRQLGGASPKLQATLAALQSSSQPLVSALPPLKSTLCQLNPALRYVEPYAPELASMIENLGSAVNAYDVNGHTARLSIGLGPESLFGVLPASIAKAENTLMQSGLVSKLTLLGYNPYPAPGQSSGTTVGRNAIGPSNYTQPYRHVLADC
jgi:phospholipid/cholesterol/gamma-HCH transport system substrate-binding protein